MVIQLLRKNQRRKKLHFIDQGIGMTSAEVEKYINQLAFSGAEEF
jgi:molecular chaperone HtpG